jgi:hypothetical protein
MDISLALGIRSKGEMVMENGNEIVTFIPGLIQKFGWTEREFIGRCVIAGLSQDTAKRLLQGKTNVSTETLVGAARVFGVQSISELMDLAGKT